MIPLSPLFVDVGNDPRRPARMLAEQAVARAVLRSNATRMALRPSIDDTASSGRPNQPEGRGEVATRPAPSGAFSEYPSETPATDVAPSQPVPGARRGTGAPALGTGPATSQENTSAPATGPRGGDGSAVVPASSRPRLPLAFRVLFTGDLRTLR